VLGAMLKRKAKFRNWFWFRAKTGRNRIFPNSLQRGEGVPAEASVSGSFFLSPLHFLP
jgi:hypothetical protein